MSAGQHTLQEILSQPEVWAAAIRAFQQRRSELLTLWQSADFQQIIVTGCGSTYYLSLATAQLLRQSGADAFALPASELLLGDSVCLPGRKYLLVTISRSGTTTETLRAQQNFAESPGGAIVCITCDSASPLAESADLAIAIDAAQEHSVAQTRSFSSMLVVAQLLAGALAGRDSDECAELPGACQSVLESSGQLARALGENDQLGKFFFLGAGALYGVACEAMLKMKEMSLSHSEAFHPLEFRHGPMSLVDADSLVIGLVGRSAAQHEIRVIREMATMGAATFAISQVESGFRNQISLPTELPVFCVPVLHLPPLQLLAYWRALAKGCDPDQPQNLSAVISLDDI